MQYILQHTRGVIKQYGETYVKFELISVTVLILDSNTLITSVSPLKVLNYHSKYTIFYGIITIFFVAGSCLNYGHACWGGELYNPFNIFSFENLMRIFMKLMQKSASHFTEIGVFKLRPEG